MLRRSRHVWAFDRLSVTADGSQRTELYRQNQAREASRNHSASFDDFLDSLQLQIHISALLPDQFERAAELTQRTNQFNLRPQPRLAADIAALASSHQCHTVTVNDRFGDYGLTGLVVTHILQVGVLTVDTMLLSCRVLARGVEHQVLAWLGQLAAQNGCDRITLPYQVTSKNQPIRYFLEGVIPAHPHDADADGLRRFSIAPEVAKRITVTNAARKDTAAKQPLSAKPANAGQHGKHNNQRGRLTLMRHIADKLNSPAQIHQAIAEAAARKMQPLPANLQKLQRQAYVAPTTPTEITLATIWADALKLDSSGPAQPGVNDNFFGLGGHSLLATQVMSKVRGAFAVTLPLRALFEAPTVATLARQIDTARLQTAAATPTAATALVAQAHDGNPQLSFAQQGLWYLDQMEADNAFYIIPLAVRLSGLLDVTLTKRVLNEIVRRHDTLRATFHAQDGIPQQVIHAATTDVPMTMHDLSDLASTQREEAIRQLADTETRTRFQLNTGPLLRAQLIRCGDQEHVLLMSIHHISADGWSMRVLAQEFAQLYAAFAQNRASPLPELSMQYADFARWQRAMLADGRHQAQRDYWIEQLKSAPALLGLPTDHARGPLHASGGDAIAIKLTSTQVQALQALATAQQATLFMTMLTVLEIVLHRWTKQTDMVIGTVIAGRSETALEPLIGCFMNFLPLRVQCVQRETAQSLLKRVADTVLAAYSHQDTPFEHIIEAVNPQRQADLNPIFNVAFVLQNLPETTRINQALGFEVMPLRHQATALDLRFTANQSADGIALACEYNTALFNPATIDAVLAAYQDVLNQLLKQPETRLIDFSFSSTLQAQALAHASRNRQHRLVVAASFTAEPIEEALAFWMQQFSMSSHIEFAPYNQVLQTLLDPQGLFAANRDGTNLILLRIEDWIRYAPESSSVEQRLHIMQSNADELINAVRDFTKHSRTALIVGLCPPSAALTANPHYDDFIAALEQHLVSALEVIPGVHPLPSDELHRLYPVQDSEDFFSSQIGHIPYTNEMFAAIATLAMRKLIALRAKPYQAIVKGCKRANTTTALSALSGKMRLLPAASRNRKVPASEHIKAMAEELQLRLDSIIFIDDDPEQCAEVEAAKLGVLVLQLPDQIVRIRHFLEHVWAFDPAPETGATHQSAPHGDDNRVGMQLSLMQHIADELCNATQITHEIAAAKMRKMQQMPIVHAYVAPSTPTESTTAAIWAELLHLDKISVADGFFDLGGHSLLATQMISRVRSAFHIELPLRTIIEAPTVMQLAKCIDQAMQQQAGAVSAGINLGLDKKVMKNLHAEGDESLVGLLDANSGRTDSNVASQSLN